MPDLPTGTVTFLFTDVEGSTRLWERQPEATRRALIRHDTIIEQEVASHGGAVVRPRGEGDSRFAVFARATEAVTAAAAMQRALHAERWPTPEPLRVRLALHTGEASLHEGDYYGPAVNRCARLRAIAHGGQALLTLATEELARDALPEGASLRDLGELRLSDLARSEHVFQLVQTSVPAEFPPPRSLDTVPNNLPVQLTTFIGREREMAEVTRLLRSTRLLTLTGTGGAGKTRLALQVAADLLDEFTDGVWVAELAALTEPSLVPATVAAAVGVREESGQPLLATIMGALCPKRLLLVLDNCEHLITACARLVDDVLRSCPGVQVLATSREGLGIAGEVNWAVPPLLAPPLCELPSPERLAQYDAVHLFLDRAVAALPGFALTAQNAPAVAQVCARLDGIPLAIELIAARLRALTAEQLAERLDQRFRLLTGGSRTALPRHQTLRAAIDWSYDLLNEQERLLFNRLSAFAGGFTLEAAEVVGGEGASLDVLDLMPRLVDKSLVMFDGSPNTATSAPRYRLPETIRYYARERLAASGEAETIYLHHARYFLAVAEEAAPALRGPEQRQWLARLHEEHDNLRAALEWWTSRGEAKPGLLLGAALELFWFMRGHCGEGLARLRALLALPPASDTGQLADDEARARANALYGAAYLTYALGNLEQARILREESLAIGRGLGDKRIIAYALRGLAALSVAGGDYATAQGQYEESLALFREVGDRWGISYSLYRLGLVAFAQGEYARARPLFEESLAIAQRDGDTASIARGLNRLGFVALVEGDHLVARALFEQGLAIGRELKFPYAIAFSLRELARVALEAGDYATAREQFRESLGIQQKLSLPAEMVSSLEGLAGVAASTGQPECALRLAGAAAAGRAALARPLEPVLQTMLDRWMEPAGQALSVEAAQAAWAEGQAMSLEQAFVCALADAPDEGRPAPPSN